MSKTRKIRNAAEARSCLAAADGSGLTRVQWARANEVDARSLHAWHLNLTRGERPRPVAPLRLVELVASRKPSAGCRVRYGDFTVDVDAAVDHDVLVGVLRALVAC